MSLGLCFASWTCFVLGVAMLRSPSPLLMGLFPAHFAFGLAAFLTGGSKRWALMLNATLLAANFAFLYKQVFLR